MQSWLTARLYVIVIVLVKVWLLHDDNADIDRPLARHCLLLRVIFLSSRRRLYTHKLDGLCIWYNNLLVSALTPPFHVTASSLALLSLLFHWFSWFYFFWSCSSLICIVCCVFISSFILLRYSCWWRMNEGCCGRWCGNVRRCCFEIAILKVSCN